MSDRMSDAQAKLMGAAAEMRRALHAPMNEAARTVLLLGYSPDECVIEKCDGPFRPAGTASVRTERLCVIIDGVKHAVFEITTTTCYEDMTPTFTIEPRLIAWPPDRQDGGRAYFAAMDRNNPQVTG